MRRIAQLAGMREHHPQRLHPRTQLLHRRSTMPQHVVAREHGILLFEHEAHVIVGVTGTVHGAERGAFDGDALPVDDGLLSPTGAVLVDRRGKVGIEAQEIGHAAGVVAVPVG